LDRLPFLQIKIFIENYTFVSEKKHKYQYPGFINVFDTHVCRYEKAKVFFFVFFLLSCSFTSIHVYFLTRSSPWL